MHCIRLSKCPKASLWRLLQLAKRAPRMPRFLQLRCSAALFLRSRASSMHSGNNRLKKPAQCHCPLSPRAPPSQSFNAFMSESLMPILPTAWLGILGGGQLGRMFCFAAQRLGYRVCVFDPDPRCIAGAVADAHLCADYEDEAALVEFGQRCAAISTEFENIPAHCLEFLARLACVRPGAHCLAIAQDRAAEKRFIADCGVLVAPYRVIASVSALAALTPADLTAVLPGILKTARLGYDGKGQVHVKDADELRRAYAALGHVACIIEKQLPIADEISALIARGADGATAMYPLAHNMHRNGILARTLAPAPIPSALAEQAAHAARAIAERLDYVGMLFVEFFILRDGALFVNEIAPRPHNSGHYTIDACVTSQFVQQVRALTGLPLGEARQHSAAVMLNLLGDLWFVEGAEQTPPWHVATALPGAHLHLYAKPQARIGRKMGHLTCTAATLDHALENARRAAQQLGISPF